jgi:anti-sigma regulatory factor (Ser/Thr protein kinase)
LFSPEFDYCVVDGLGRARQRGIAPKLGGRVFRAASTGPCVEFANLAAGADLISLSGENWFDEASMAAMLFALTARPPQWLARDRNKGFLTGSGLADEGALASFKIDAHKAALSAGFGKSAALIAAALGELIGNVVDHSEDESSGLALFSNQGDQFEIVVADTGIGALNSLAKNPEHASLSDHGEALQAMVETGVSRFVQGTGHGNGFRPIFEKLADMTGRLRFRSGDYALTLDGRFGDRIARQVAQKPRIRGFLAAVTCCPARGQPQ